MKSQNVIFEAAIPEDQEIKHPAGAWLARQLRDDLAGMSWETHDFDNWRDCGWSICCSKGGMLNICFAQHSNQNEWFLQVSPFRIPGFVGKLLGKQPSATEEQITCLARDINTLLKGKYHFKIVGWKADGAPDGEGFSIEAT